MIATFFAYLLISTVFDANVAFINAQTGDVIIEFYHDRILFHEWYLEEEMKTTGILIPHHRIAEFEGKEVVYLNDSIFRKAFFEVYSPLYIMNSDTTQSSKLIYEVKECKGY